jgi:hypothetical protein
VGRAGVLAAVVEERGQRGAGGVADVEAPAGAAQVAMLPPPAVGVELVGRVEPAADDQAVGQAQGHRGVVGPLAWFEVEGAAADQVVDRLEGVGRPELQGGADGVPGGEAEQAAAVAGKRGDGHGGVRDRGSDFLQEGRRRGSAGSAPDPRPVPP